MITRLPALALLILVGFASLLSAVDARPMVTSATGPLVKLPAGDLLAVPDASGDLLVFNPGTLSARRVVTFGDFDLTFTGGGTLGLGGFTFTVPATGTADLLGTAQTLSALKTFTGGVTLTTAGLTLTDVNASLGTTTGTKWGTATSQKQAWWNATPIVQPSGDVITALGNLGLVATPTISATALTGVVPIANGGTNSSTALSGSSIMVSNGSAIIQGTAGTSTTLLHGNASGVPTYGAVTLTADVTGILPSANGGTGVNNAGTITNATNTTITGGGTLALGGFTLTVPATGTAVLLSGTQTITGAKTLTGGVTISTADATITDVNVVLGTTTGTKWGTATSQKQAWWNATPIVQPSGDVITALGNLGLVATPTISATALTGIVPSANGGTGVNNAGTITNATNTTITGGGTLALAGFTLTAPATGTVALRGTANTFTAAQTDSPGTLGATSGNSLVIDSYANTASDGGSTISLIRSAVRTSSSATHPYHHIALTRQVDASVLNYVAWRGEGAGATGLRGVSIGYGDASSIANDYASFNGTSLASAVISFYGTTSASAANVGAFLVGNGTAATTTAVGGGNINTGGTLTVAGTSNLNGSTVFGAGLSISGSFQGTTVKDAAADRVRIGYTSGAIITGQVACQLLWGDPTEIGGAGSLMISSRDLSTSTINFYTGTGAAYAGCITNVQNWLIGSGATTDNGHRMDISGGTVTTAVSPLNLTQTWNASGITFPGLKLAVTNTASAAASKLFDLTVGGTTQFGVQKDGQLFVIGSTGTSTATFTATNKPGASTAVGPTTWVKISVGGASYWMPAWAD